MGKVRVTNEVLLEKLENLNGFLRDHATRDELFQANIHKLLDGNNGTPGMRVRLDRLEQTESSRLWNLRMIWASFVTMVLTVCANWVWG